MLDALFPTIARWLPSFGSPWRLSTWWLSDTLAAMQQSLLRLLSVAHREHLDVTPLVANLANEHRGRYRRRLRRLARRLSDGTPLIDALEQTPDSLSDEDVLALRLASQTGTLGATYDLLVSTGSTHVDRSTKIRRQTLIYSLITFIVLALSISFLVTFIVPTMKYMQEDFGLPENNPSFQTFLEVCKWVGDYAPLLILGAVVLAFLYWSAPSRRFFRRMFGGRWIRAIAQSRSSQLLRMLATTVEAGRPVPAAISTLARYHFDRSVRQKLLFARNEIEQGADVWTSLSQSGLLSPQEAKAISQSSSSQSRAWSMHHLANWKLQQVSDHTNNRIRFVQPIVTILFAAVVLLIGGAMIGFLAHLIQSIAAIA